jgi:glucosamine-6-phosphate deaminase
MAPPTIVVVDDYETLSATAADVVVRSLSSLARPTVVVATGETPMGLYEELARRRDAGTCDPSSWRVFQLDEYSGVHADDPRSLFGWMVRSFVDPLGIPAEHVVALPGVSDGDARTRCAAYDREVEQAGGFDLAILGIGLNGHLGFNEPPSDPTAPTREVSLSPESIRSSARYLGCAERVPERAVTVGMAALLRARHTVLLASGGRKRKIVRRALKGPVTEDVPASFLQRTDGVTVLVDRQAWDGDDGG